MPQPCQPPAVVCDMSPWSVTSSFLHWHLQDNLPADWDKKSNIVKDKGGRRRVGSSTSTISSLIMSLACCWRFQILASKSRVHEQILQYIFSMKVLCRYAMIRRKPYLINAWVSSSMTISHVVQASIEDRMQEWREWQLMIWTRKCAEGLHVGVIFGASVLNLCRPNIWSLTRGWCRLREKLKE